MERNNFRRVFYGFLIFMVLVGVIVFFVKKQAIKLPEFADSILEYFNIENIDYVGGMIVNVESYLNKELVDLDKYKTDIGVLTKIFEKFGYPEQYIDLMMFPSTNYVTPKMLTIEFRNIDLLSQLETDNLVFQTYSNEELLLGYESKYMSEQKELVYTIYISENHYTERLAIFGIDDVINSFTYHIIDIVQLGLYHSGGVEYDFEKNIKMLEEIKNRPLFVVDRNILSELKEWIIKPVYAEVRCIGQYSCPQATRVCTCSVTGYDYQCSASGQICGLGGIGTCSCGFTSVCSGAITSFACDWEITAQKGCQLQSVSCSGPQFCSTTATAFDCYASAYPDPTTPPVATNTPIPTNTPRPGCTCGPCSVCLSPGTYADSCGNAGACTCCGTTISPTPITGGCPGVCCWPGMCNGSISSGNAYCDPYGASQCCTSCINSWPSAGYRQIWFYEDNNRNGVWDVGEVRIVNHDDPRIAGGTISWSGGKDSGGQGSQIVGGLASGAITAQWPSSDSCPDEIAIVENNPPLVLDRVYSFSSSFDVLSLRDVCWGGHADCNNAMRWGWSTCCNRGCTYYGPYNIWVQVEGGGGNTVTFNFAPPTGSLVSRNSIMTYIRAVTGGGAVDVKAIAFGIQPPLPNPPTSPSLVISNVNDVTVTAISGRNHICQDEFRLSSNNRRVKFWVGVSDADGASNIATIALRFNNNNGSTEYMRLTANSLNTSSPTYSIIGGGGNALITNFTHQSLGNIKTAVFTVEFNNAFVPYLYDLDIYAQDITGETLTWTDAGRDFKVWDCKVPVSGSLYDSQGNTGACTNAMYTALAGSDMRFTNLNMEYGLENLSMNVNSPNYSDGGNRLAWGVPYIPRFNNNLNASGAGNSIRITDIGDNSVVCGSGSVLINETNFNPYASSIEADVDFSVTQNQEPWYQGRGVSILGLSSVRSKVPVTCAISSGCTQALTIDWSGQQNNGAVMSNAMSNIVGCSSGCSWGIDNDWYRSSYSQNIKTLNYNTMYDELNGRVGVRTANDWTTSSNGVRGVGGTGVVFVDRDLIIDANHSVAVGNFLMVVVRGNITINTNVTTLEGAYIANGNISIGGTNSQALNINGMIYATSDIVMDRGYENKSQNNTSPAVRVNMRPDLIFNAPSYLFERISYIR